MVQGVGVAEALQGGCPGTGPDYGGQNLASVSVRDNAYPQSLRGARMGASTLVRARERREIRGPALWRQVDQVGPGR
jgi:hypothetical protein